MIGAREVGPVDFGRCIGELLLDLQGGPKLASLGWVMPCSGASISGEVLDLTVGLFQWCGAVDWVWVPRFLLKAHVGELRSDRQVDSVEGSGAERIARYRSTLLEKAP